MGYSAIVYLAALSGVPVDLYEATKVEGADKFRQILSIDLPHITPTIITLFILNAGSILSVGFEKMFLTVFAKMQVTQKGAKKLAGSVEKTSHCQHRRNPLPLVCAKN